MPKNENIDAFWDIEDLIPGRPKKTALRREFADTEATEISLSSPVGKGGEKIPPRASAEGKKENGGVLREYGGEGLISFVKILSWPTAFEFYTKFRKDAVRYFSLTHEKCEYVYFFSYMPQYEQMTVSQMSYYLYWRDEARKENYLKTDINYLFLYIYEIINLPDKIAPTEGAKILSRLWRVYRKDFLYLDKYLGEWLCDYCLIHHVSPDWEELDAFCGEIVGKVSLPEFYLRNGEIAWSLIEAISSYDYRKSKYYEAHENEFDLHIPKALEQAVNRVIMKNPEDFGIVALTTSRDSYAGAIVFRGSKFKMEITRYALRKTSGNGEQDLKHIFANLIKFAENQLRGVFGIKSRFSPMISDARLKQEILDYFNECFPSVGKPKKKKTEEESYMAFYEPKQTGPADISRALDIEKQAWETADLLSVDEEAEEPAFIPPISFDIPSELPVSVPIHEVSEPDRLNEQISLVVPALTDSENEFGFVTEILTETQREALRAALKGSFSPYCRSIGVMEENMRGEINEIAMEYIGDMMIDGDFSVLEDYEEDIRAVLEAE
jgi:predicted PP-loop superfamily ATPase